MYNYLFQYEAEDIDVDPPRSPNLRVRPSSAKASTTELLPMSKSLFLSIKLLI